MSGMSFICAMATTSSYPMQAVDRQLSLVRDRDGVNHMGLAYHHVRKRPFTQAVGDQVDQLQQLSRECSGRSARAFLQLSREGQAYAVWDAERRARHLEQVQSALGFLDWCRPLLLH